jgi:hypothetical protein
LVEELQSTKIASVKPEMPVQSDFFDKDTDLVRLIDEYIQWPAQTYWNENCILQPEPLEYYQEKCSQGVWIIKPWVLHEANQLIGLADMRSTIVEDIKRLENCRDQDDESIAKLLRREEVLKCVDHWMKDYTLLYPEIKRSRTAEMGIDLIIKNFFNSSVLHKDDYFGDEWIALQNIKYPKGIIEGLEKLKGIRIEKEQFKKYPPVD